ncbi:MAG: hypothetical protein HY657_20310 [Acidobacteria bacterium]|nr:hypothetical protein [Acidobacteriota bacterium]
MWTRVSPTLAALLLFAGIASAEVVRIDIRQRDDAGTHERLIGRVFFEVDPTLAANRGIADLALALRSARGRVEFSSDLLLFLPKSPDRARGTVFLEVVNRGIDQSLGLLSGARQVDAAPESWTLGDRFHLEQGFTVAFLGWQFDVRPSQGLAFQAPVAPVDGTVRVSYVEAATSPRIIGLRLPYCAAEASVADARVTFRTRIEDASRVLPRETWQFDANRCVARFPAASGPGIYEVVYQASGSPVAGLGLAAIRDFASYLKYGPEGATLRENPALMRRVIGFGYSQSGRFLREFVRDGFNADERGRAAFDGLLVASAGAGGGSFNHRFAMPGQAGNSVLSILRPVDLPPFTDDGLLAKARATQVVPKIFYTVTSTEYWARAASLTHTSEDGTVDVPLAPTSRLYFIAGTPHASGVLPPTRVGGGFQHNLNFAQQRWTMRALLVALDEWVRADTPPPPSVYPTIAKGELVPLERVRFPVVPSFPFAEYMPQVWRMDYGPAFADARVITLEPPALGAPFRVLVPQVDADGNDRGGIRIPEIAVPLGTYTGWNVTNPQLRDLRYLAGLLGSFEPFAQTADDPARAGDARPSIAERYRSRGDHLDRVAAAAKALVAQRLLLADDVPSVVRRAEQIWTAVVATGAR